MYFLNSALSGMRRRMVASVLTIFGGAALLTASAAIGLWSYWLIGQESHIKAVRAASVFIDSSDSSVVEEVLTKVMQVKGVETARIVSTQEFSSFLKEHFPDLQSALADLGDDVIPRMLEVVFPADGNTFARRESVDAIGRILNVARVDDGALRLGKALASLQWLGYGGTVLALGLWLVLFIVCLGHYQNILYTDAQEIQLIRSFGATKAAIFMPWMIEAIVQSLATGVFCILVLFAGKTYLAELYNQFFGAVGYEPFHIDLGNFMLAAGAMAGMALAAHLLAGLVALARGRIV
ncbi:MAG: cell division protein FtsX [Bacteriovoracia bacterium]